VPLGVALSGGNRNDVTQLPPLVDGIGAIAGNAARLASAPTSRALGQQRFSHHPESMIDEQRVGHAGTPASTLTFYEQQGGPGPTSIPARDVLLKPLLRPAS
jgi:hypothetical protein